MRVASKNCAEKASALAEAITDASGGLYEAVVEGVEECTAKITIYTVGCLDCGIDTLRLILSIAFKRAGIHVRAVREYVVDGRRIILVDIG